MLGALANSGLSQRYGFAVDLPTAALTSSMVHLMMKLMIHHKYVDSKSSSLSYLITLLRLPLQALMEKDQSIMDYQETVEILQVKVRKLEQLVKLKDRRIDGQSQAKTSTPSDTLTCL
jgi:DNA-binding IclR family transcriptional regulator